jgi:Ca2+-binding RTX toxin-like protein
MIIEGTSSNDKLTGTDGNDVFDLSLGGDDVVRGLGGDDTIRFGASLTAADRINGGDGNDTVVLAGDYSTGLLLNAHSLVSVETLKLAGGFDYKIVTKDAAVAAGLTVDASALGAVNGLTFKGALETIASFTVTGGAGDDIVTGGRAGDIFNLGRGGSDRVDGGGGDDQFLMRGGLSAGDRIDGGDGTNTMVLDGNYAANVTLAAHTLTNIDTLNLGAGHKYNLTLADAATAAGDMLTVDGSLLGTGDKITFNNGADTNASLWFTGGAGNDVVQTGDGDAEILAYYGGNDTFTGGAGNDEIRFGQSFTAADKVDGRGGDDTVWLDGDYSAGVVFNAATMVRVERIYFTDEGFGYDLTTADSTVAAGKTLTVSGDVLHNASLIFDGSHESDGDFRVFGGAKDDVVSGGAKSDYFDLTGGGNDTVRGGGGADYVWMSGAFSAGDSIDGGAGTQDAVVLFGLGSALTLGATTMVNVEFLRFNPIGDAIYDVTTNDATVVAGGKLTVDADVPGALIFDGSAETDGRFEFVAGSGSYTLTGGAKNDLFNLIQSGTVAVTGGGGSDTFKLGGTWSADDRIDGGGGNDVLLLEGTYGFPLVIGAAMIANVERVTLAGGHSYQFAFDAGAFSSGTLTVDASQLGFNDELRFDASNADGGTLILQGGDSPDTLVGGSSDTVTTLRGAGAFDQLSSGGGVTDFVYADVSDSTGEYASDVVHGFNAATDHFIMPVSVTAVDFISTGPLGAFNFVDDLNAALSGAGFAAGHAAIFTPDDGYYAGKTMLVVDANGVAGYQDGEDYLIKLFDADLTGFGIGNFETVV